MTQFLPLTAAGLTYVLSYDPSGTPNQKPSFTSTAVTTATEGGLYAYTAVAEDPEDDAITYSLDTYPTGMTIGTYTGIIHWVPTSTDTEAVVVRATDSNGAYSTQSFDVTVGSFAAAGGVDIDAAWLADADNGGPSGPYYLDTKNKIYRLQTDVTTDGTAFVIINSGITFNLNGHTITYDNAAPITVANGSFEVGTGSVATGWDFTHAPNAERFYGEYLKNEVYDGDYSLKFSSFTGDQYVVATSTVTLEANTTYSLSGMFWNGASNWVDGVSTYAKLVGQNVASEHIVSWTGRNDRGIQFRESVFTTGNAAETYKVVAGASKPVGAESHVACIDDIKIQRTKVYGVSVSAHSWDATSYPGVTRYGRGTNAIVMNGTVTQGQDNGTWGHAIYSYSSLGTTTVHNTTLTVAGPNSSAVPGSGERFVITDNDITSNVKTITSRDNYHGAVITGVSGGTISRNIIHNGPHAGINANNSTIDNNTIQLKVKYTNAFAIRATGSSDIHHNTINCGSGDYAALGIMVTNNATGSPALVHDNTVTIQLLQNNQEYGGGQMQGAYAIQVEGGVNGVDGCEIYNNTMTVIANEVGGTACRIGAGNVSNVHVHDNHFVATRTGEGVFAAALKFTDIEDSEMVFEDNILETNSQYVGYTGSTHNVQLVRTSLEVSGDTAGFRAIETSNWRQIEAGAMTDLKWIDTTFHDAATKAFLTDAFTYVRIPSCTVPISIGRSSWNC